MCTWKPEALRGWILRSESSNTSRGDPEKSPCEQGKWERRDAGCGLEDAGSAVRRAESDQNKSPIGKTKHFCKFHSALWEAV